MIATDLLNKFLTGTVILALVACGGSGGGGGSPSAQGPTPTPAPAPEPDPAPDPEPVPEPEPAPSLIPDPLPDPPVETVHACNQGAVEDNPLLFSEITLDAGLTYEHSMPAGDGLFGQTGGVAAGDIDNDGWIDLYAIGGEGRANLMLINQKNGGFVDVASDWRLDLTGRYSGPAFGDINGDALLDLFIGNASSAAPVLLLNLDNGNFSDITQSSLLELPGNNVSASFGDKDADGDLDLFVTHWSTELSTSEAHLWENNGDLTFTDVTKDNGISWPLSVDRTFSPSFADMDNDGNLDLVVVADNANSKIFRNVHNQSFEDISTVVFSDQAGMGSAIGDYDNDGDLDWFVSSIQTTEGVVLSEEWTAEGNRFYENQGAGVFADVTDVAGVRDGRWGWGACFADFNNDGHLDLFHVNGMLEQDPIFANDLSRLFMANGDKTFTESAIAAGVEDDGQGRGVVCFDYDKDGDLDIFVANHNQAPKLYCNNGNANSYISVRLVGLSPNTQALGARIYVTSSGIEQMRELRAGNNYVSQNPVIAHFGLAGAQVIDELKIVWPDGTDLVFEDVGVNQHVSIEQD